MHTRVIMGLKAIQEGVPHLCANLWLVFLYSSSQELVSCTLKSNNVRTFVIKRYLSWLLDDGILLQQIGEKISDRWQDKIGGQLCVAKPC